MADELPELREIDWDVLVDMVEGEQRHKKDIGYEFSNGRKFEDKEEDSTLYNP